MPPIPFAPNQQSLNILFILADDIGAWALGFAGNEEVKTPNLDRLANSGLHFTNAFCASPVCSPARASILTGKIPSQHGVHDWVRAGNTRSESSDGRLINYLEGQTTYTDILKQNGYHCGLSGKWHLGNAPTAQHGHDYWAVHAKGGGSYYNAPMIQNGEEYSEPEYVTNVITDRAINFLDNAHKNEAPFYLGVHYTAPHSPWGRDQHPAEFFDPYYHNCPFESVPDLPMHPWQINSCPWGTTPKLRREYLSGYYSSISAMDNQIGRILTHLDKNGQRDNTLIIFTGDNGMNMGHHGIYGKGNGTYPQNMYDTSVKIPFLVNCPQIIPAGATNTELFSHYDFLPTLLDLLNMSDQIPNDLPGRSFAHHWRGVPIPQDAPLHVFDEYAGVHMIRTKKWKYIHRFNNPTNELYDLANDPDESTNLIESDPKHPMLKQLQQTCAQWFSRYMTPNLDGRHLPVYGKGQVNKLNEAHVAAFNDDYLYLN